MDLQDRQTVKRVQADAESGEIQSSQHQQSRELIQQEPEAQSMATPSKRQQNQQNDQFQNKNFEASGQKRVQASPQLRQQSRTIQVPIVTNTRIVNFNVQPMPIQIQNNNQNYIGSSSSIEGRDVSRLSGREISPNRYYPEGGQVFVSSKKSISPPQSQSHMLVSFGPGSGTVNQQFRQNQVVNLSNAHNFIRSRIISEVEGAPVAHLPDYLRDQQLKQQIAIKPQSSIIARGQANPFNPSVTKTVRPNVIFQTSSRPQQYNSRLNQNQNPQAIRQIRNLSPPLAGPINYGPRIVISTNAANANVSPIIQSVPSVPQVSPIIQNFYNVSIYVSKIQTIYSETYQVTELIKIMLNGQSEKHKQDFIRNLLAKQTQLQQKLLQFQKDTDIMCKENSDLKAMINSMKTGSILQQAPQISNKGSVDSSGQITQLRLIIQKLQVENKQLSEKLRKLQVQYNQSIQKNSALEQKLVAYHKQNNEEQLLSTIQNQKSIIKKLEEKLIQQASQPATAVPNISINSNQVNSQDLSMSFTPNGREQKIVKNQSIDESLVAQQQSKYMTIIQSKDSYINQLEAEIIRYKTQVKNLKKQLIKQRNEKNDILNSDEISAPIQRFKNYNYQGDTEKFGNIIIEKEAEIKSYKQKIFDLQDQFDVFMEQKDTKIKQLYHQISDLSQRTLIEDKRGEVQLQIQKLKGIVLNKDEEILKLRQQKTSRTGVQQQLKKSLQMKDEQEGKLHETITILQHQVKQLKEKSEKMRASKAIQEQNSKLKENYQIHLNIIQKLEDEIGKLQQHYRHIQQQVSENRRMSSQKEVDYQNKIKELSEKNNQSNHADEGELNKLQSVIQELNNKIKSLEQTNLQMSRRVNDVAVGGNEQDFRLHYSQSQVKIFELQAALKSRQTKIKQLQNNIETYKVKTNFNNSHEEDFIAKQQVEMLRKKVMEYEAKLQSYKTSFNPANRYSENYEKNYVFEQKVIYELKSQNEKLKALLAMEGKYDAYLTMPLSHKNKKISKSQQSYVSAIQTRLVQFNRKLEQIIMNNRQLQGQNNFKTNQAVHVEFFNLFEREKATILRRHQRQIQSLQIRMADLQRYCSTLENYQDCISVNTLTVTQAKSEQKNIFSDQMSYYKQKNKQLEERVDVLLVLNKQLKDKLENHSKSKPNQNIQYYRQQIAMFQKSIADYESRIKKMAEDKNNVLKELGRLKQDKTSQTLIHNLQSRIRQLNGIVSKMQQQNGILDYDLKKYIQQVKDSSSQSLNFKTSLQDSQQKIISLEQTVRSYTTKMKDYEDQITKLANQNQILKSEIDRLHEQLQFKKMESKNQLQTLKTRIYDLQQQIRNSQSKNQSRQAQKYAYQQNIKSLNIKIMNLQSFYKSEIDKMGSSGQRIKQLQNQLSNLQNRINQLSLQNSDLKYSLNEKNNEIASLHALYARLQKQWEFKQDSKNNGQASGLEQAIRKLREEIQSVRREKGQIFEQKQRLQSQNQSLVITIQELKSQLRGLEAQLPNIRYYIECIRSIFVEIEILLSQLVIQKQPRQASIWTRVHEEITNGLTICSQIVVK